MRSCNGFHNEMKTLLEKNSVVNLALWIMLIGVIVFSLGFGICLYIAQKRASIENDEKVQLSLDYIQHYIDSQLRRVEDLAANTAFYKFDSTTTTPQNLNDNDIIYASNYTEEGMFSSLESILNHNKYVCGVALGMHPSYAIFKGGPYGFAVYVTNVTGKNERLQLGNIHDYSRKEWFNYPFTHNQNYWSHAFRETKCGKVVTCFSIPVYDINNKTIGVVAYDVDTEKFRDMCKEISPLLEAEISLLDRNFNFISNKDTTLLLSNISETANIKGNMDNRIISSMLSRQRNSLSHHLKETSGGSIYYMASIKRSDWTVIIKCPMNAVYGSIMKMFWQTLIIAIISIIIMIICMVWLFRKMQKMALSKASIENDLKIASDIQRGMIPPEISEKDNNTHFDIYGIIKPAKEVGGDIYDYFVRDGKLFFCIGDVSGKGIPAAIFMAIISSLFRNISYQTQDPAQILSVINKVLCERNKQNHFCTMIIGVLNIKTGNLQFCNAGHNAPIIKRHINGKQDEISFAEIKAHLPIGVFDDIIYQSETIHLQPGESIFLYTDGITEAENCNKDLLGGDALIQHLQKESVQQLPSAKSRIESVLETVRTFTHGAPQSDDITMLLLEMGNLAKNLCETLHLTNKPEDINTLTDWLENISIQKQLSEKQTFQLNLAMEEVVTNVIQYAYPQQENQPIDISFIDENENLTFIIDDQGIAFNPLNNQEPDTSVRTEDCPIGGLGIMITRTIMSSISYQRIDGHNLLTLIMKK